MKKHPRLGRPGAGARDRRSAHARRLLLVLIGITRRLDRLQADREIREAYLGVLRELCRVRRELVPRKTVRARRRRP